MYYCDPCREKNSWPTSMSQSRGRCENCGDHGVCNDTPSYLLPTKKAEAANKLGDNLNNAEFDNYGNPMPVRARDRIDEFLELFTDAERQSWKGKNSKAPNWVTLGVAYFLGEEPANKELMRRLKESGD